MLTKEITYEDFNGHVRTESFYFNLNESELAELTYSEDGGLPGVMKKIIATENVPKLMSYFKKIILLAYGEKSNDGRRLIKSEELSKEFEQTNAYDKLFMELFTDGKKANEFFKSIIPSSLRAQIEEEEKNGKTGIDAIKSKANIAALPTTNADA